MERETRKRRRYSSRESFTPGQIAMLLMPTLGALVALGGVITVSGVRPVKISIEDGDFSVFGAGYRARVPIVEITDLSLDHSGLRVGRKLNGFNLGSVLRGRFHCKDVGECQVFADRDTSPFLIVRSEKSVVMVSAESPAETRQLYRDLKSRLDARDSGPAVPAEQP